MSRNIGELSNPLQIGDVPGLNYSETREDGTIRLVGSATCYKDMIMDLFGRRLNGTTGKVDYDWDNNAIKFQSGGAISTIVDRVQGNQEINHEFMVGAGTILKPHFHWFQAAPSGVLDTAAYELTMRYRLVRNGYGIDLTTPVWTDLATTSSVTNNIFDNTNLGGKEYLSQITTFSDVTIECGVSDTVQVQLARTDSLVGDMLVYFFDIHAAVDSFGSDDVIDKEA